jgi:hypothetical protein
VDIVVLDTRKIKLIEQCQCVLHVDVVIRNAVHDEESDILGKRLHVGDGSVVVTGRVVLRRMHVTFSIDGIC